MIGAIIILLSCQLAGEVIRMLTEAPIPGPVFGMALLFLGLVARRRLTAERDVPQTPRNLGRTADGVLNHLSLLFVPAGVGVMIYLPLLAEEWLAISVSLVASTVVTIALTALVMSWLARMTGSEPPEEKGDKP